MKYAVADDGTTTPVPGSLSVTFVDADNLALVGTNITYCASAFYDTVANKCYMFSKGL